MKRLSDEKKLHTFVSAFDHMTHSIQHTTNSSTPFHKKNGAYPFVPMSLDFLCGKFSDALRQYP